MSRTAYRYTPAQLLALLRSNRFSFLTDDARERIDALMEVVTFDVSDHAKHCDEHLRWNVVGRDHQVVALNKLAICRDVYQRMVGGKSKAQAILDLLADGNKPWSECPMRADIRQAVLDLELKCDFNGIRRIEIWTDRLVGQDSDLAQMLALVDEDALAMSEDRYIERLAAGGLKTADQAGA
ncbi:hypothetical protein [Herbaspirillum huttiense]|uniref:hypothetical protein n=1 Tax=Herbaspirillum huttiense TaxID=863372 RepID=UPI0039AEBE33